MEDAGRTSPWLANLFRLSPICGLWPGKVKTLKWGTVDLTCRKMTLTGKTGASSLHLTDAAIEVGNF